MTGSGEIPRKVIVLACLMLTGIGLWVLTIKNLLPDYARSQHLQSKQHQQHRKSDIMLRRMEMAQLIIQRKQKTGQYTLTNCSDPVHPNSRPPYHYPHEVGQDCEAWLARTAIEALDLLFQDPDTMNGLEWGSGSSSMWAVTRLRSLVSVEHDGQWFQYVDRYFHEGPGRKLIEVSERERYRLKWYGAENRWKGVHFEPRETGEQKYLGQDNKYHEEYVVQGSQLRPLGIEPGNQQLFDYVMVDGRARIACLEQAVKMVIPDGGILILDNSDREHYKEGMHTLVPAHWVRYDFTAHLLAWSKGVRYINKQNTSIWISLLI